jgi:hypothetical protein
VLFAATGGMVLMEVVMVNKATHKFTQQNLILEFLLSSVLGALIALQISGFGNTTRVLNSSSHVVTM